MKPKITIVICTYNRGFLLSETIPTVFYQDTELDEYEVLIVNNNSDDNTKEILQNFQNQYTNIRIIEETNQGLSHAKNAGMVATKSDWIVYLDDDAKLPKDFVRKVLHNIDNSSYSCFGGVYLPWYKYGKPRWFKDEYASNKNKLNSFGTLTKDFLSGGIMAIKRNILLKYDGFSTQIGMKGKNTAYGEETLLQINLRKDGVSIGYDPNWIMYHLVSEYKLSTWWFLKSGYYSGKDYWTTYDKTPSANIILKYIYRTFKNLLLDLLRFSPKIINKDYYIQNWIIDVFNPMTIKFGQIHGGFKYVLTCND